MVAGPDAALGQCVREARGAFVCFGEREVPVAADESFVSRNRVGHAFPQVGEVVLHAQPDFLWPTSCGRLPVGAPSEAGR